jgi:tetratricopeptide (TPR) repeat protein
VGAGIPLLLAVFVPLFMQGESTHRAVTAAQREVGPGYSFYVGQLSTSGNGGAAVVTAYSDTEIRKVVVEWSDEKEHVMTARYRDAADRAPALVEGGSAEGAPDAQQHVLLGYELYRKGKYAEAVQEYDRAISLDSQSAEAYFYHGLAAHRLGDEARALADLRSSIQLDPRRLDTYRQLDAILARQGRWDEIIGYWNDFLGRDSTNAQAFLERGGAFSHKGDREHARQDVESACRLGSSEGCQILARFGNTPNP